QELGPCIDAKTDVGAESCHLSLAHFFALDRLPSNRCSIAFAGCCFAAIANLASGDTLVVEHGAADIAHVGRVPDLIHCVEVHRHRRALLGDQIGSDAADPCGALWPDAKVLERQRAESLRHSTTLESITWSNHDDCSDAQENTKPKMYRYTLRTDLP